MNNPDINWAISRLWKDERKCYSLRLNPIGVKIWRPVRSLDHTESFAMGVCLELYDPDTTLKKTHILVPLIFPKLSLSIPNITWFLHNCLLHYHELSLLHWLMVFFLFSFPYLMSCLWNSWTQSKCDLLERACSPPCSLNSTSLPFLSPFWRWWCFMFSYLSILLLSCQRIYIFSRETIQIGKSPWDCWGFLIIFCNCIQIVRVVLLDKSQAILLSLIKQFNYKIVMIINLMLQLKSC